MLLGSGGAVRGLLLGLPPSAVQFEWTCQSAVLPVLGTDGADVGEAYFPGALCLRRPHSPPAGRVDDPGGGAVFGVQYGAIRRRSVPDGPAAQGRARL